MVWMLTYGAGTLCASSGPMQRKKLASLFNHLISLQKYRLRDGKSECFGDFEVHHKLKFGRLRHGQRCWLCPFQDFVCEHGTLPGKLGQVRPVGHESPEVH